MKNDKDPKAYVPQELVQALEHLQELTEKHRYNVVGALELDNHDASRPVEAEGITVFTAISPHRTLPMQLIYRFAHDPDPDTVLLDMYLDLVNIGQQDRFELFKIIKLLFGFIGSHLDVEEFLKQLRIQAPAFSEAAFDLRSGVSTTHAYPH